MDDINPQVDSEPTLEAIETTEVETPSEPAAQTEDSPSEQPSETFDWGGRKLTAKELHEEARRLQSDYTKKSQKLSEYERISQQPQQQQPNPIEQLPPEERIQLEQAAKQLSPFLAPVLQEEVNKLVEQRIAATMQEKEQVQQYEKQFNDAESLAKKAGIPFDRNEMVEYMKASNNWNVMDAFKSRNFDKLMEYQITQKKAAEKKPTTVTTKKPAPQEPERGKVKDITEAGYKASLTQKLASMLGGGE